MKVIPRTEGNILKEMHSFYMSFNYELKRIGSKKRIRFYIEELPEIPLCSNCNHKSSMHVPSSGMLRECMEYGCSCDCFEATE